ncbi:hypothetical protein SESBI_03198 [Sesbania bispinosa]|nr:hypothetical protein SESBI_03198 [Sesbania bispinosa]
MPEKDKSTSANSVNADRSAVERAVEKDLLSMITKATLPRLEARLKMLFYNQ